MRALIATIEATGAFGTPLKGDTLFGQLCWMIRYRQGEAALEQLLEGYTDNSPFVILSDALPHGHAPRPELPPAADQDATTRKEDRKKRHIPLHALSHPLHQALKQAVDTPAEACWHNAIQPHNSIRRLTGTTGAGADPFQMPRQWAGARKAGQPNRLDIHIRLDPERMSETALADLLQDIGTWGFGRDASIGLGRFQVVAVQPARQSGATDADAWLTLAPCAPQLGAWDTARCFWKPFTRFGRHGGNAAHGNPFKSPVLLADTGAIFTPAGPLGTSGYVGRGLGGDGRISRQIPQTVHQGYAPAIPVKLGPLA